MLLVKRLNHVVRLGESLADCRALVVRNRTQVAIVAQAAFWAQQDEAAQAA